MYRFLSQTNCCKGEHKYTTSLQSLNTVINCVLPLYTCAWGRGEERGGELAASHMSNSWPKEGHWHRDTDHSSAPAEPSLTPRLTVNAAVSLLWASRTASLQEVAPVDQTGNPAVQRVHVGVYRWEDALSAWSHVGNAAVSAATKLFPRRNETLVRTRRQADQVVLIRYRSV